MLRIDRLTEDNIELIKGFDCGNLGINRFLQFSSLDSLTAATYVFHDDDEMIGFFSLCADAVKHADNNTLLGSAIRILMFAIDNRYQKQHVLVNCTPMTYAHLMLDYCIDIIRNIVIRDLGAQLIILSSTNEGKNLYAHCGSFYEIELDDEMEFLEKEGDEKLIPMYRLVFDD